MTTPPASDVFVPIIHGRRISGNCYKVKLICHLVDRNYIWKEYNNQTGETSTPEFLAMNPNGKVPVLEYAPGKYLPESNAILFFLSQGSGYWPNFPLQQALVLKWMFFEQYSHEPYIAVARFICIALAKDSPRREELPRLQEQGNRALQVMEQHLAKSDWLVGNQASIADVSLFAYTHSAAEGGFTLTDYPAVGRWLERFTTLEGFVPLEG